MEMKLQSMTLENFKGVKNATYDFDGQSRMVCAQNGLGKTTINTAYLWVLADRDADLNGNPSIRPMGVEESTPTVTLNLTIDGKPVSLCKKQTCKKSKPDANGICKISLTNSYEKNSVPMSERDFKMELETLGVDYDRLLYLSHPDVFSDEDKKKQRALLFSMADNSKTDYDIASATSGCENIAKKLVDYKLDEVEAMVKASDRKVAEEYGKDGEILNAKIEGLELAKTETVEISAAELAIADANKRLADVRAKIDGLNTTTKEVGEIHSQYMDIKFRMGDIERRLTEESSRAGREMDAKLADAKSNLMKMDSELGSLQYELKLNENRIANVTTELEALKVQYKNLVAEQFDENSVICPTCGQEYPVEKASEMREAFAESKAKRLALIEKNGKDFASQKKGLVAKSEELNQDINNLITRKAEESAEIEALTNAIKNAPKAEIDPMADEEYKSLSEKLKAVNEAMEALRNIDLDEQKSAYRNQENEILAEIDGYKKQITANENNERIDDQIMALRDRQTELEQIKLDNDVMRDEIALLKKTKNLMLTDSINQHFSLVKWNFFTYQKNGEYKETIEYSIDGFKAGESTNTGRELLAKIDIIKGLQDFFNQHLPLFIDGFECLSESTKNRIAIDTQLIGLCVTEDSKLIIK